jgi:large subunit ribosomal protein L29
MAVGSKDLASEQLRGMDDDRLVDELRKAKEELFNLRFRAVRKDIARIYTEMRERELGIGSAPAKPVRPETSEKKSSEKASDKKRTDKKASEKKSAAKKAEKAEAK